MVMSKAPSMSASLTSSSEVGASDALSSVRLLVAFASVSPGGSPFVAQAIGAHSDLSTFTADLEVAAVSSPEPTLYPLTSPWARSSFSSSADVSALASEAAAEDEPLESPESFDPSSDDPQPVMSASDSAPIAAVAHSRAPDDLFMSGL